MEKTFAEKAFDAVGKARLEIDKFAEKIAPLFARNKWEWSFCGVPSKDDIAITLNTLCSEVLKEVRMDDFNGYVCISTGRLQVRTFVGCSGRVYCVLELTPESRMIGSDV